MQILEILVLTELGKCPMLQDLFTNSTHQDCQLNVSIMC